MATRAGAAPDWRAAFRRSFRRATHMAGAGILFALLVFLTLALASYTQTDPSPSTAASGEDIRNWMGASGAWASERALNFLGIPAVLLLPLLYISARRLWTGVERDDETETPGRWWGPFAMLLAAVALLGTVLALVFEPDTGSLPAGAGGLFGQLEGLGIEAVAERFGGSFSGWIVLVLALLALGLAGALKLIYWRRIDAEPGAYTADMALGLKGVKRQLEPPHSRPNYVMREMGYDVARRHAETLRRSVLLWGFLLPGLMLAFQALTGGLGPVLMPVAVTAAAAGLVTERWLFFAEATHLSTLYYGNQRA